MEAKEIQQIYASHPGVTALMQLREEGGKKRVLLEGLYGSAAAMVLCGLREKAPDESFFFLQTGAVKIGGFVIVGSRGWTCPGSPDFTEQDKKLYLREAERFRLAFLEAEKLKEEGDKLIAMIHYPPFNLKKEDSLFTELFEKKGVDKVVFGHLHGGLFFPLTSERGGISYHLTSCDKTDFRLIKIF